VTVPAASPTAQPAYVYFEDELRDGDQRPSCSYATTRQIAAKRVLIAHYEKHPCTGATMTARIIADGTGMKEKRERALAKEPIRDARHSPKWRGE
jgi:hypothetical protein